jgi:hypothetical protein
MNREEYTQYFAQIESDFPELFDKIVADIAKSEPKIARLYHLRKNQ